MGGGKTFIFKDSLNSGSSEKKKKDDGEEENDEVSTLKMMIDESASSLGMATTAIFMSISVIALIVLFSDINDLHSGVMNEMTDFKEIADDTWSKILSVRSNEFHEENRYHHGFQNFILRTKRQYPSHCR
ncbi:hypothetical protein DINM_001511 [Dirofilaria immitis]|nr:hypothetical protein [Dirofilaria immitis]